MLWTAITRLVERYAATERSEPELLAAIEGARLAGFTLRVDRTAVGIEIEAWQ